MTDLNSTIASITADTSQLNFGSIDYIVFFVMLAISAGIGAYFGFFTNADDTTEEYLHGGKQMKTIPIAISLVASQLSGISIMTIPVEMYSFGINWFFNVVSIIWIVPILCWVVIPVFYNNNISNCYEYLQTRFNRKTRELMTLAFIGTGIFMLPVFIFIPALAFAQVTGINIHLINTVVCSICVFYTMFGGIKAVVWTDVVQAAVMVVSVTIVGILGCIQVGGVGEVFRIAAAGRRLDVELAFDSTTRASLWNSFLSSTVMWSAYVGLNQSCVQRIVSLPSLRQAKKALIIFGFGFLVIMFYNCFTGFVMYARYHDCDPISAGYVEKGDKMMPYFVQDIAGHLKGMPGVFISCVFSASLSTMSASLNSLSGVVYFDYIKPRIKHTESRANFIMKAFVLIIGLYCILAGTVVEKFTSIFQMVYSISGVTYGGVFGIFLLGMLVPKAHGRAAFWAVVASMLSMLVIVIGAQGRLHYTALPTSIEACSAANNSMSTINSTINLTSALNGNSQEMKSDIFGGFNIFQISFNWYAVLGASIVFIVGIPLSYILPAEKDAKYDPKLLSPLVQRFVNYELTQVEEELPTILTKGNLKQ